jgi:hypothetical protein
MPTGSGRKSIPTRHNSNHSNLPLPESSFRPRHDCPSDAGQVLAYKYSLYLHEQDNNI